MGKAPPFHPLQPTLEKITFRSSLSAAVPALAPPYSRISPTGPHTAAAASVEEVVSGLDTVTIIASTAAWGRGRGKGHGYEGMWWGMGGEGWGGEGKE